MKKPLPWLLAIAPLIVLILPFILLSQYTSLSEDDFSRAHASWNNFFAEVGSWYLYHNGRYTNAVLSFLPIYNFPVYQLTSAFSFLFLFFSIFVFIEACLRKLKYQLKKIQMVFLSIIFFIFLIFNLDSPAEFFYWYAGMTVYLISLCLLLLLLSMYFKGDYNKGEKGILFGFLIVVSIGNNEMLMAMINMLLFLFLLNESFKIRKLHYRLLLFNILAWISSAFVFFAPGTTLRRSIYPEGGDLFHSLKYAFLHTGYFSFEFIANFSFWLFFTGMLLVMQLFKKRENLMAFSPVLLAGASFGLLAINYFVLFFSQGVILALPRVINFIESVFYILAVINFLNFSVYASQGRFAIRKEISVPLVVLTISGAFILKKENFSKAVTALTSGEAELYRDKKNERLDKLSTEKSETLTLQAINGPDIIHIAEIPKDSTAWQHKGFKEMVKKKYNPEIEIIQIDYK